MLSGCNSVWCRNRFRIFRYDGLHSETDC